MSFFTKLDEATLGARSFLHLTKSKQRISPSAVQIVRLRGGKGIKGNPLPLSEEATGRNAVHAVH
jgi:hypothetical protein